jgi:hypothetical protein
MRYNTGTPSPTLVGAQLIGGGMGYRSKGPVALVSRGIDAGPLGISGLGSLGDDSSTTPVTADSTPSWLTQLASAATSVTNLVSQQQLNQINIQRAAQGLAPLPQSVIGPTATVGLSSDVQNLLIYGGLAFAGLFMLNLALKR